ncbi:hypothetical protein SAMN06295909_0121 [Plantibacter sp. VKM Ac-1784]|uniref:Uncharacterized protein n=1 Tax=Plantibacter elymi (nom. nud.) TaxID=199708 RepID=A0ABY1RBD5_9MICO|nr:hypothetical protein [Plantibacter sp. VKM Ac-1784]SMQ58201.1 hypothetical protein SAMN06295909_0121 [Plantibacter sp. VKM Ac-1784]
MAVRRSAPSSIWTFFDLAPRIRLYRDDVDALLKLIRDKGATAALVSGNNVEMDAGQDISSLSGKELRDLAIKTRNPEFSIDLQPTRARVTSTDGSAVTQAFGTAVIGFLGQHKATGWERVWLEISRSRSIVLAGTAVLASFVVPTTWFFGLNPFLLLWIFAPSIGSGMLAALTPGTGTWVTRRNRADVYQRREDRGWSIVGFIGTTIFGGILGAGITYLLTQ